MNDFIIALGVTAGGSFLLNHMDGLQATASQQASCKTQGGTWGGPVGQTTAAAPNPNICNINGQPVNSSYTMWGPVVDLGIPIVAAILLTRSLGGTLGAGVGAAAMFFLAISQIH